MRLVVRFTPWFLLLCVVVAPLKAADRVTPEQIDVAVKRGVEFLKSTQKNGNWEALTTEFGKSQPTGLTALATYALLASGEKPNAPHMAEALKYLRTTPTTGIYALSLRAQVWNSLKNQSDYRSVMANDNRMLARAMGTKGDATGMFHYQAEESTTYDHSTSQFGILGLWAMREAGLYNEPKIWKLADTGWRKHQGPDGAWGYVNRPDGTIERPCLSMTVAGVASLYITQGATTNPTGCVGNVLDPNIERGVTWIGNNFQTLYAEADREPWSLYSLFGLSRIGIVSGRKYFGDHDWFVEGTRWLVPRQKQNGAWGTLPEESIYNTSFAILFLARSSAPVLIQKLEYRTQVAGYLTEGPWSQRPRDIGNLVTWMGGQMERNFNWQSTPLDTGAGTLHDAPILYIGGSMPPVFNAEEKNHLRNFVEEGGLILGSADCGSEMFNVAFRKLGLDLFPAYQFRELPADHPIYTSESVQYKANKWRQRPSVLGVSNGVRELMLLLPSGDASRAWQAGDDKSKTEVFQLASNIVIYATDNHPLSKGRTHIVKAGRTKDVTQSLKLARLSYNGNWDPEPGGWRRLAAIMRNRAGTALVTEPVRLGDGTLKNYRVAHLTGTEALTLTDAMRDELNAFLAAGGTLIIDAAGGSTEFVKSMEEELSKLDPNAKVHAPLPETNPALTLSDGSTPVVTFRQWARGKYGLRTTKPQIQAFEQDGRLRIFYSPQDLSAGLVGQQVDGINGYTPQSATDLMEAILLSAMPPQR